MSLVGDNRAQAVYDAINATGSLSKLNAAEKASMLAQLKVLWGADTTYLTGNAVVQPSSMQVPAGVPVSTAGTAAAQTGSTTAPGTVGGTGTLS